MGLDELGPTLVGCQECRVEQYEGGGLSTTPRVGRSGFVCVDKLFFSPQVRLLECCHVSVHEFQTHCSLGLVLTTSKKC